jgi:hypothetical protein
MMVEGVETRGGMGSNARACDVGGAIAVGEQPLMADAVTT